MEERMCGGTFFTLLAAVKRPNSRRPLSFMGMKGTVSEPGMLKALVMILNPEYQQLDPPRAIVSKYKNCEYSVSIYLPFDDSAYTVAFHEKVVRQYHAVLNDVSAFCKAFLQTENPDKVTWLGSALLELLLSDSTISPDEELFISQDGRPVRRQELAEIESFSLPALILGCWDYIIMRAADNTVGKATIAGWLKEKEYANSLGRLKESVGSRLCRKITVTMPETDITASICQDAEPAGEQSVMQLSPQIPQTGNSVGVLSPSQVFPSCPPAQQFFSGINVITSPGGQVGQVSVYQIARDEGTSVCEMMGLDPTFYNLFVIDGDALTSRSFTIPKEYALSGFVRPEIRKRFLPLSPEEQIVLTNMPAIFATVNQKGRQTEPDHQALVGRLTGIRLQNHDVRFQWKPYCVFPQQILNQNEPLFDIWTGPAVNELSEEHWTIKQIPLFKRLREAGIDPFHLSI